MKSQILRVGFFTGMIIFFLASVSRPDGIISTVAGVALTDGIPALEAQISNPGGVAIDSLDNIYFADTNNNRIRRVDSSTGLIKTIAGNGMAGFLGDGGPASAAELDHPQSVAIYEAGAFSGSSYLFIADTNNNRIRRIDLNTGIIITLAGSGPIGSGTGSYGGDGGLAQSALFNQPGGILYNYYDGNVYVADTGNNRIRRFSNSTTATISLYAGNGTAGLAGDGAAATAAKISSPLALAADSSGNVYVADSGNYRVRKIALVSGIISTVAGSSYGNAGDGGPATSAQIGSVNGVAFDSNGNLYLADASNSRIRAVYASSQIISPVAGVGLYGFSGDGGPATAASFGGLQEIAFDTSSNLFICDSGNNRIREIYSNSGNIQTVVGNGSGDGGPANLAQLSNPGQAALDPSGRYLYIPEASSSYKVRKVDLQSGIISTYAGNGQPGYSGDGGPATAAELTVPFGCIADSAGDLFISDLYYIRKVGSNGIITTYAGNGTGYSGDGGPATAAGMAYPIGLYLDSANNLFIAEYSDSVIRKVNSGDGKIYTVAGKQSSVGAYSGDGGPASLAQLNGPIGVWGDASGNLYIADAQNNVIRKVSAGNGFISTIAGLGPNKAGFNGDGGPATQSALNFPTGVLVDSAGNIFISDFGNNRIRKIDASTGIISTVVDSSGTQGYGGDGGPAMDAQLSNPIFTIMNSLGDLYISDYSSGHVRKVTYDHAPQPTMVMAASGKTLVYPSPTSGRACFAFSASMPGELVIKVYNVAFQLVATLHEASVPSGPQVVCEDVSGLANGAYIYQLSVAGNAFPLGKFKVIK